jgi:hypothetical protein
MPKKKEDAVVVAVAEPSDTPAVAVAEPSDTPAVAVAEPSDTLAVVGTIGPDITLEVGPDGGKARLVIARQGDKEIHRDRLDTDKATSREKFVCKVAATIKVEPADLGYLHGRIVEQAEAADALVAEQVNSEGSNGKASAATQLVELANSATLFHSPDQDPFATLSVAGHNENWSLHSKYLEMWLRKLYAEKYHRVPNAQALQDAISMLEAKATFDSPEYPVYLRVAGADETIYIDLGDETWDAIKVTAAGWTVVESPPVRFIRSKRMLPLPRPKHGGSLDKLWQFLNCRVEDRPLLLGWLVQALRPSKPFPDLVVQGPQGCSKSTTVWLLRSLIDPNRMMLRAAPRDTHNLAICAKHNWVCAFDNLSYIGEDLSDALCRLSTGGGFAVRALYTDSDEATFDHTRPVILNGIEEIVNRADLLERAILVELPEMAKEKRKTEKKLLGAWEKANPLILGALLDAVSTAIKNLPNTVPPEMPRMADFAVWAHASETRWGSCAGKFLDAYKANQETAQQAPLEASPIVDPLCKFLRLIPSTKLPWKGTATGLLQELEKSFGDKHFRPKGWPADGRSLSNKLRRLVPNLKKIGVIVEFSKSGPRWITIATTKEFDEPAKSSTSKCVTPGLPGEEDYDEFSNGSDDAGNNSTDGGLDTEHDDSTEQEENEPEAENDGLEPDWGDESDNNDMVETDDKAGDGHPTKADEEEMGFGSLLNEEHL